MTLAALLLLGAGCVPAASPLPSVQRIPFPTPPEVATNQTARTSLPPAPPPAAPIKNAIFGVVVTLTSEEAAAYDDGTTVRLVRIDGARCAPGAKCAQPGVLSALLRLTGSPFSAGGETITLTSSGEKETVYMGYRFTRESVTSSAVTFKVEKTSAQ
jgi:hypothetical protein